MKKTLTIIAVAALAVLLLAGCLSNLPDGFDDEAISVAADKAIKHLNAKEFDQLCAMFEPELQDGVTPEMWEEKFGAVIDKKGAFDKFENVYMMGHTDEESGEEFAYVQAVANYENGTLAHSLYLNIKAELVSYQLGVEEGDIPEEASSAVSASSAAGEG